MTKQIIWTKNLLDTFIEEGNLNRRQEYLMRTRLNGYKIAKQAFELNLSIDQVNKEIAKIKRIYDIVSYSNPIFPKRKEDDTN